MNRIIVEGKISINVGSSSERRQAIRIPASPSKTWPKGVVGFS